MLYWPNKVVVNGCSSMLRYNTFNCPSVHYLQFNRSNRVATLYTSSFEWFIDIFLNIVWFLRNFLVNLLIEKAFKIISFPYLLFNGFQVEVCFWVDYFANALGFRSRCSNFLFKVHKTYTKENGLLCKVLSRPSFLTYDVAEWGVSF